MSRTPPLRHRRLAGLACVATLFGAFCLPASAQTSRTYAVLSLAVDSIELVTPRIQTGSSIDRNIHNAIAMPDDSMDITAVQAVEVAMKTIDPTANVELYVTRDPKIYAQAKENSPVDDAPAVVDTLKKILGESKATHLLLVTKHRSEARFRLHKTETGMGKVYGVGFYTDESLNLVEVETGNRLQGFVAPFASLKFQLIDLAACKTVRQGVSMASDVYAGTLTAASAWTAMSPDEKAQAMQRMIRESVTDGVRKVFIQP